MKLRPDKEGEFMSNSVLEIRDKGGIVFPNEMLTADQQDSTVGSRANPWKNLMESHL